MSFPLSSVNPNTAIENGDEVYEEGGRAHVRAGFDSCWFLIGRPGYSVLALEKVGYALAWHAWVGLIGCSLNVIAIRENRYVACVFWLHHVVLPCLVTGTMVSHLGLAW